MTMPHLMNCRHSESGWCLNCVKELHDKTEHNTDHLTDLITNAIDDAIRNSKCSSYSEWQTLIHHLLTSQHCD